MSKASLSSLHTQTHIFFYLFFSHTYSLLPCAVSIFIRLKQGLCLPVCQAHQRDVGQQHVQALWGILLITLHNAVILGKAGQKQRKRIGRWKGERERMGWWKRRPKTETRGVWVWFKWKWESFWTDVKHRCLFIPKQSRTGFGECSSSPRKGKDVISVRICLPVSEDGKQIGHAHTQPHSLHNVFFHKQNTHAAKSIKNHQLSSKQDLQAQSHWRGREEVICRRSVSDSRAEELSSENCCPSFNSDTKPKQKPHQFGLITPPCRMWSTYGQFIYHKSQSTFYAERCNFTL